jgi:hypothetical protein
MTTAIFATNFDSLGGLCWSAAAEDQLQRKRSAVGLLLLCVAVLWLASPVIYVLMECQQRRNLDVIVYCHVVLDSIQGTQHQVEHADGIPQGVGQLLNDDGKAALT